jgi:RNA polymerase sigma factor (sigma-70 family)
MSEPPTHLVTRLLDAVSRGEEGAMKRLYDLVYEELHRMAQGQMAQEHGPRTLQPTALVHEVYLQVFGRGGVSFENRRHLYGALAQAMRRILVDGARKRGRLKRRPRAASATGGDTAATDPPTHEGDGHSTSARSPHAVPAEEAPAAERDSDEILDTDEALKKLEVIDPPAAEIVKQHYFLGLSIDAIADVQGLAPRTVDNRLRFAKALLRGFLSDGYA